MIRRRCPYCGNEATETLFTRDFSRQREIVPFSSYKVCSCKKCGGLFAGEIEESMPLIEYYELMSKYENDSYSNNSGVTLRNNCIADLLSSHLDKKSSILDIGAARGALLNELKKRGFTALAGLEPSLSNVEYGRREYGIDMYQGAIGGDLSALGGTQFDMVILEQTCEHLIPLYEDILEAASLVKPNGFIGIGVPDADRFKYFSDFYQQFSCEHINYITEAALTNLMGRAGFESLVIDHSTRDWCLHTIWKKTDIIGHVSYDYRGVESLRKYIDNCKKNETDISQKAKDIDDKYEKYNIYCCGTRTAMLFQIGALNPAKVVSIMDINKNFRGHIAYGCVTSGPHKPDNDYPIIVTGLNPVGIAEWLKNNYDIKNEIIPL